MFSIPFIVELCKTSEKLQEAYQHVNCAREETAQIRQCLTRVNIQLGELSHALAVSEAWVKELQSERDMLSLLVTSFQYTANEKKTRGTTPPPNQTEEDAPLYEP